MQIEVIHIAVDTDDSVNRSVEYAGELTPRRLAKALRKAEYLKGYFGKHFPEQTSSSRPHHRIIMTMNGEDVYHDIFGDRVDGKSWAEICDGLR